MRNSDSEARWLLEAAVSCARMLGVYHQWFLLTPLLYSEDPCMHHLPAKPLILNSASLLPPLSCVSRHFSSSLAALWGEHQFFNARKVTTDLHLLCLSLISAAHWSVLLETKAACKSKKSFKLQMGLLTNLMRSRSCCFFLLFLILSSHPSLHY